MRKVIQRKAKCRCCQQDVAKGSTMWEMGGSTFGTPVTYHYCEPCVAALAKDYERFVIERERTKAFAFSCLVGR